MFCWCGVLVYCVSLMLHLHCSVLIDVLLLLRAVGDTTIACDQPYPACPIPQASYHVQTFFHIISHRAHILSSTLRYRFRKSCHHVSFLVRYAKRMLITAGTFSSFYVVLFDRPRLYRCFMVYLYTQPFLTSALFWSPVKRV